MGPLYTEAVPSGSASATLCAVNITELSDPRRAPDVLGMMGNRAIVAPADREAWLRSVFEVGLHARGFAATFTTPDASAATPDANAGDALIVRVSVRSIWLSTVGMNKTAAAVLHVAASRGSQTHEADYRGDVVLANWAGTQTEFNGALERAFARALDAIAVDLRPLCAAG